ncbi:hypothetical protein [Candidatus Bathycorpusculum sp.]|uniref:hypothetical protein n=1 Tax=Candidatus Bathycorpusculum sp. TaxID=2994959 RepID=UPI002822787B|nr:hypothetical protein [Candidatus Termitimicrobium sp.]MCL2685491.1 hypothetical protein [Candidatus Termitimicrobium sp.]
MHSRQVSRRNSSGKRIRAAIAIRRADATYTAANVGFEGATFLACPNNISIRCRAICLMLDWFIILTCKKHIAT